MEDVDDSLFIKGLLEFLSHRFEFVAFEVNRKDGFLDSNSFGKQNLGEAVPDFIAGHVKGYDIMHSLAHPQGLKRESQT